MPPENSPRPTATDSAAFVAELRPALVAFFQRRCGNPAEAEDLAQDVLVRALTHARWRSTEEARGYIFRIAINRWRDRGRRKLAHGTEVEWSDDRIDPIDEDISLERVLSGREELRRIVGALGELHERTRDVLVMCRLEHMRHAEVAEILGISASAVEKHLVKALAHLMRRMERDVER